MTYVKGTTVPVEKSKAEIEALVARRGARKFASMVDDDKAMICFFLNGPLLRFSIDLPSQDEDRFHFTQVRMEPRSEAAAHKQWEQECRRIWRALKEVIKAKLIAIDEGVYSFEQAFLPDIVMPDGKNMSEHTIPQIEVAYETGKTPPLLPSFQGAHQ